jgi:hypothetical protein
MEEPSDSHLRQSSASFNLVLPSFADHDLERQYRDQRLALRLNAVKRL